MRLKSTLLTSAAAAAVMASLTPAQAGSYVSLFGGWNRASDIGSRVGTNNPITIVTSKSHTTTGAGTHTDTVTFNFVTNYVNSGAKARDGFVIGAAVGGDLEHWMHGLRAEFEIALRRTSLGAAVAAAVPTNTTDTVVITHPTGNHTVSTTLQATSAVSPSGNIRTFSLMANAWYDFDLGGGFKPYVGGGVGYASNEVNHGLVFNASEGGGFAWQLGAGVNYPISDGTSIGVGYRYFDAGEVTLKRVAAYSGQVVDTEEITNHSVLLNVNFAIGK